MKLMLLSLMAAGAFAQAPDLNSIPSYKKEYDVVGGLRIAGSELKGSVDLLVEGFRKFQPNAKISTNSRKFGFHLSALPSTASWKKRAVPEGAWP